MNWKRLLIAAVTRKKYKAFLSDTLYPELAQLRLWTDEIVPLLQKSVYWQPLLEYRKNINLNDFDITTYEDYEEKLLAAHHSHTQPFNGEELIFWSETSGTSGVRKFFPITASFQQQFQRTMAPYIHNLTQLFPGFFKEKILYLVAVDANKSTPAGTPSGWISNYNYRNLPGFIKRFYALPNEVFADSERYNQWAPLYALASDLSAIFAVTPMVIDTFYNRCSNDLTKYLPYLSKEQSIPDDLPPISITRKRLRYLQELAKKSSPTYKELWPSLQLTGCWTSGLCEYPAQQSQKQMGPEIVMMDGTYSATEGWLTVPLDKGNQGGYLHPGAHIFEFIEEGLEIKKENLLHCWQLEVGTNYEVFLTTAMGFVRYQLKDIVKCTGYLNKAPKLLFCYKTQLLKLESCAVTGQELQAMLQAVNFNMAPSWYFARNSLGNMIVLVTDDAVQIADSLLAQMHEQLIKISPTYAHSVETEEVLPLVLLQLPKEKLIVDSHAQTKPKLISQQVISVR